MQVLAMEALRFVEYLPASHSLHVNAPSMSEKVPAGHAAHLKFDPL